MAILELARGAAGMATMPTRYNKWGKKHLKGEYEEYEPGKKIAPFFGRQESPGRSSRLVYSLFGGPGFSGVPIPLGGGNVDYLKNPGAAPIKMSSVVPVGAARRVMVDEIQKEAQVDVLREERARTMRGVLLSLLGADHGRSPHIERVEERVAPSIFPKDQSLLQLARQLYMGSPMEGPTSHQQQRTLLMQGTGPDDTFHRVQREAAENMVADVRLRNVLSSLSGGRMGLALQG